ncbi:hypothetical protein Q8F55_004071 [Vanrija albida]|uniref:MARVEL domain-containing protein n=1 Tax=Vanrija albida TaxID=181172 RepID=A0ABR3Q5Y1_9TREE
MTWKRPAAALLAAFSVALAVGLGTWTAITPLRAFGESAQQYPPTIAILQLIMAVLFLLLAPIFLYAFVHAAMSNEKADLWLRLLTVVPTVLVAACCIVLRFLGRCTHYFEKGESGPRRCHGRWRRDTIIFTVLSSVLMITSLFIVVYYAHVHRRAVNQKQVDQWITKAAEQRDREMGVPAAKLARRVSAKGERLRTAPSPAPQLPPIPRVYSVVAGSTATLDVQRALVHAGPSATHTPNFAQAPHGNTVTAAGASGQRYAENPKLYPYPESSSGHSDMLSPTYSSFAASSSTQHQQHYNYRSQELPYHYPYRYGGYGQGPSLAALSQHVPEDSSEWEEGLVDEYGAMGGASARDSEVGRAL